MEIARYVVIALVGALASILANKGIAVFNDGYRPIMGEYLEGRMNRKDLAATSLAISIGLIIGFGIPTSLAANIILIHCILLATDVIGAFCPDNKTGVILAGIIGAVYGVALLLGLEFIVNLFGMLPVNFLDALGQVATPIVVSFAIFPAVTVGLQYGFKKGMITAVITLLARQITAVFGTFELQGNKVTINADGIALMVGMIVMLFFAIRDKEGKGNSNEMLTEVFEQKVSRIQKSLPLLAVMGGLLACGTSMGIMAGDPISLNLLADGARSEAAMSAFARAIGFIPLVATTAITTGVYAPAGMTFVFVIGLAVKNPILAFVLGAVCMSAEVLLLNVIAKGLDKFPGVRRCGDNIRTAMSRVLEVALLMGGLMAAQAMAPGLGIFIVIGLYCLNKISKKPIVDMAVGPVGAIATGIIINILYLVNLYVPPVV